MRTFVLPLVAVAALSAAASAQGIAPTPLGPPLLDTAQLQARHSLVVQQLQRSMTSRTPAMIVTLPSCPMPVATPDLRHSEQMPGSHAPTRAGTEAFGCTNPLGPRSAAAPQRPNP